MSVCMSTVLFALFMLTKIPRHIFKLNTGGTEYETKLSDLSLKLLRYEGVSINNQNIPFSKDQDGHDFYALFQYMLYTWVQNCTRIESFFNKILNVKHG